MDLKQNIVKSVFFYKDGYIYWRINRGSKIKVGDLAGSIQLPKMYWYVMYEGVKYRVNRLIWIYHNGGIPDGLMVDHKDTDRLNNLIENLRLATNTQNQGNALRRPSLSGLKGATAKKSGNFEGHITHLGKRYFLGTFKTAELAHEAYCLKAKELYGEFFNPG